MNPEKLTTTKEGRTRLFDLFKETGYELFVLTEETVKRQAAEAQKSQAALELPDSSTRQWSITILDEGAPEPNLGHAKNQYPLSPQNFITRVTTGKIPASQLTPRKLERLMDRYAGREWLPTSLVHLDEPDSERADVVRGLTTYLSSSAENARTFSELYAKLPEDRRALPASVLSGLSNK